MSLTPGVNKSWYPVAVNPIRIAAAVIVRPGETLLVRKRGTTTFIQPGGKIEPGESPEAALCRELAEELNLVVTPDELVPLGPGSAPAVNEPGHTVVADFFLVRRTEVGPVGAEIAEARWVDPHHLPDIPIAPLSRTQALPRALASKAWASEA